MYTAAEMEVYRDRYVSLSLLSNVALILQDIDERSLKYAQTNVNLNSLGLRIKLLKTAPDDLLIPVKLGRYKHPSLLEYLI